MRAIGRRLREGEESLQMVSRTVQWRIDTLPTIAESSSSQFTLGNSTWCLQLAKKRPDISMHCGYFVRLVLVGSVHKMVHATFALRIAHGSNTTWQTCFTSVSHHCFERNLDAFTLEHEIRSDRVVVEVEFMDLKKISHTNDQKLEVEWPPQGPLSLKSNQYPLECFSRMFTESIHTDFIVNTESSVSLDCHRSVLAAASPVFSHMFDCDFNDESSSTVNIQDMSFESCKAFLSYLYGTLREEEFWEHIFALLEAAHKYDVEKFQNLCEEILLEDLNSGNVLDRLYLAHFYQLANLKKGCLAYLFDLGKVYAITDAFHSFLRNTDKKLAEELTKMMWANQ